MFGRTAMSRLDAITDWKRLARRAKYCVRTLARSLQVTTRQLERYFHSTLKTTPKQWLDKLRMEDAKRLLRRGAPIKEVADRMGFKYPEHFARAFERLNGMAPSRYFRSTKLRLGEDVAKRQEMSRIGRRLSLRAL